MKPFRQILKKIYPVGSIYMSVNNTNPSNLFGGTWVLWGAGRVPVGVDTTQTEFDTVEKTGGEKTHTLTLEQIPKHKHTFTGTAHSHTLNNHTHTFSATTSENGAHNHTFNQSYGNILTNNTANEGKVMAGALGNGWCTNATGVSNVNNHSHTISGTTGKSNGNTSSVTATGTISEAGSGNPHNNLQPYITCYMWKRTA